MLLAIDFTNLHEILQALYQDMMPLCEKLTGVAKGIAGLGALFYVADTYIFFNCDCYCDGDSSGQRGIYNYCNGPGRGKGLF